MDKTKSEDYKGVFFSLLLAAGAFGLAPYYPVAAVAIPFLLAYALAAGGYLRGGLGIALCLFAGYIVNPVACALLAAVFLPPAVAAGIAIRSRMRLRDGVVAVSTAALCGAALCIGVLWLILGQGPVDYAVFAFGRSLAVLGDETVKAFYQIFRYPDVLSGAVTQSAVQEATAAKAIIIMQDMLSDSLNLQLVGYIINYALAGGLLLVVITRAFAKRRGIKVSRVSAFSELGLPKRFWLAYLVSLLAALIGADLGWPGFDTALLTIQTVYSFVFTIQGIVFLDFLYKKRGMGIASRVALHILVFLLAGFILMILGIIENISGLRKRLEQKGGTVS